MKLKHLLIAPLIWVQIVSILILDIFAEVYHRICFPILGLKMVKRGDFIKIDRHKLPYLNLLEKLGCMYCGYVTGVVRYVAEIAGRTEKYFCPIKHKNFKNHDHHTDFAKYGNEKKSRKLHHKK